MKATYDEKFKVCKKCNQQFPNTKEFFYHARQKNKDGSFRKTLRAKCKKCYCGPKKERVIKTHKTCKKCNTEYLNSDKFFRIKTDSKGCRYLNYQCRKCDKEYEKISAKRDTVRYREKMSKFLGVTIDEYKTRKYIGWCAYKRKNPESTFNEYLNFQNNTRKRVDLKRKQKRDNLDLNYVKQVIKRHLKFRGEIDLDQYPEYLEAYKINMLIKRKVYEKYN